MKQTWMTLGDSLLNIDSLLDVSNTIGHKVYNSGIGRKALLNQAKAFKTPGVRGIDAMDKAIYNVAGSINTGIKVGAGLVGSAGLVGGIATSDNFGEGVVKGVGGAGLGAIGGAGFGAVAAAIAKGIR